MTRRTLRIFLTALAACAALPAAAPAHVALPDLVADPPERPVLQPYAVAGQAPRLLLRFDGHVHNAGAGALEIERRPARLLQRLFDEDGRTVFDEHTLPQDRVRYETTDGHDHFHLQRIARYSLWSAQNGARVAPALKVGFCLLDSLPVTSTASARYTSDCARGRPDAPSVTMGVSAGWRDLYDRSLPFQWVDVSHTVPGRYRLHAEMDPDDLVEEADEANVPGETPVTVPGHVAGAGLARLAGSSADVTLTSTASGSPGARRFRVEEGPRTGTLDVPTGTPFTASSVRYTADPAVAPGPDERFVVSADSASGFPATPVRATIAVGPAGVQRVALAGVPGAVVAGTMTDLDARVLEVPGAVEWLVDGIPGGDASVGTVAADGRYIAPAVPPPAGRVTISARVAGGSASDALQVVVLAPPAEEPAPSVPTPEPEPEPEPDPPTDPDTTSGGRQDDDGGGTDGAVPGTTPPAGTPPAGTLPATPPAGTPAPAPRRRVRVGAVRARRTGPWLAVAVTPSASGRLRVALVAGRRRLGLCVLRVRTGRQVVCRLRGAKARRRLVLTLRRPGGRVETRSLSVAAALRART